MMCNWTCPKYWGNGPKRSKKLKKDHFHRFPQSCMPTWITKKKKKMGKQLHVAFLLFHPILKKALFYLRQNMGKKTQINKNTKK